MKYTHLTQEQRIRMDTLLNEDKRISAIAATLGVHRSTVYRERNRNAQKRGRYCATHAQICTEERKERFCRTRRLTKNVRAIIEEKLHEEWSPEQIAKSCKTHGIVMVSHERIYQFIYHDKEHGGSLYKRLRRVSKPYRRRSAKNDRRGKIPNRVSIDQRPDIVARKQRHGDWEVDTIVGARHRGAVLTLVERKSYFTLLAKLDAQKADLTSRTIINLLAPFKELVHTITSDNGHEFTNHRQIAEHLEADFYFTHPYAAWEKAINENTNGLIRQYIPKKSDLRTVSVDYLKLIEHKVNTRPRKALQWQTPLQVFMSNFSHPKSVALGS